jgi:hypothetical protein
VSGRTRDVSKNTVAACIPNGFAESGVVLHDVRSLNVSGRLEATGMAGTGFGVCFESG